MNFDSCITALETLERFPVDLNDNIKLLVKEQCDTILTYQSLNAMYTCEIVHDNMRCRIDIYLVCHIIVDNLSQKKI